MESEGGKKKMDYNMAALKVVCEQLKAARQTNSQSAMCLGSVLFQRAWLQGILVSTPTAAGDGRYILDDGTGVIELTIGGDFINRKFEIGMYIMVVGMYTVREGDLPMIKAHKLVDLSTYPDREAMWYLEVMEAYKLFYQHQFDD